MTADLSTGSRESSESQWKEHSQGEIALSAAECVVEEDRASLLRL